jgi:hypothetical protein
MTITQEEIKRLLHYDPETGVFTWRVDMTGKAKAGAIAGCAKKSKGSIYVSIRVYYRSYLAHRLAWLYMTGKFPRDDEIIRHIDDDRTDNRWCNLVKTVQIGIKSRNNSSGICGVCWCKKSKKWRAGIKINSKETWLGGFDTILEAACARKSAELRLKCR